MVFNNGIDNDSWYVLAEGREIVEDGVYYEDQLSMHEGLEVTVQNYGFAAIFYLVYSAIGGAGIYIIMILLNLILMYLIYKISMLLSHKNVNLSLIIMMATDLLLSHGFVVTRAQMVSYVILTLVIYLLELYAREGKKKQLFWIPILSLAQINLHASLWPMILIVITVYMIDGIRQPVFKYEGYKFKPLILTFMGAFLVGFLNPYGFKMMTFILTSYNVPEANDLINELNSFALSSAYNVILYAVIVVAMILYIFGKNKNIRLRYLFLIFGFLALGLNTVKGMSHLILVLLFPLAEVYQDFKIKKGGKLWLMAGSWAGLVSLAVMIFCLTVIIPNANTRGPDAMMTVVMDVLDGVTQEETRDNLKVYADYNSGGYVEYRGYRAYIDPRMEVFIKANNGKEDIFQEFYNLKNGLMETEEFLDKYNFDFLVVYEYDRLYDKVDEEKYDLIFTGVGETENESDGVKLYRRRTV